MSGLLFHLHLWSALRAYFHHHAIITWHICSSIHLSIHPSVRPAIKFSPNCSTLLFIVLSIHTATEFSIPIGQQEDLDSLYVIVSTATTCRWSFREETFLKHWRKEPPVQCNRSNSKSHLFIKKFWIWQGKNRFQLDFETTFPQDNQNQLVL